jgi:hypothetical protein
MVINSQFSDGVIVGAEQINPEMVAFALKAGKPILPLQSPDGYADAYASFYDEVLLGESVAELAD